MYATDSDVVGYTKKDSELLLNTRGLDDANRRFVPHPITPAREAHRSQAIAKLDVIQGVSLTSAIVLGAFFFVLGSLVIRPSI